MSLQNYEVISQIGSGTYSIVYKVYCKSSHNFFAMKEIKLDHLSSIEKEYALTEVKIFKKVEDPNVIKFEKSFMIGPTLYLIMELATNGDLQEKIFEMQEKKQKFPIDVILLYTYQILSGLHSLHSMGVLHRDIKASNILIMENNSVKIGDLNVGKQIEDMLNFTKIGTPVMMSPEIWNGQNYSFKTDIWSLGCLVYQLAALSPPFIADNHAALYLKISKGKYKGLKEYPKSLERFISKLLKKSPVERPDCSEILMFEEFKAFKCGNYGSGIKFFEKKQKIMLVKPDYINFERGVNEKREKKDFSPLRFGKKRDGIGKINSSPISIDTKDVKSSTPRIICGLNTRKNTENVSIYRENSGKLISPINIKKKSVKKIRNSVNEFEILTKKSLSPYRSNFISIFSDKNKKKSKLDLKKLKKNDLIAKLDECSGGNKKDINRKAIGSINKFSQGQSKSIMRYSSLQKFVK